MQAVVGAVEQELCAAGDGAELADYQPVMIDGIVIEHIVLFKVHRIMDKVVVYGVVAYDDVGILDDLIEIDRLAVSCPGISIGWIHVRFSFICFSCFLLKAYAPMPLPSPAATAFSRQRRQSV